MKKVSGIIIKIYTVIAALFLIIIKLSEIYNPYTITGKIEYSFIILNFIIMGIFFLRYDKGNTKSWIPLGLCITLIADYALVLDQLPFEAGVFFFILVQLSYGKELRFDKKNISLRLVLFLIFALIMCILGMPYRFSILCGCSIAILLGNVTCAWHNFYHKKRKIELCFALGLSCFAGCDICLGLGIITAGTNLQAIFNHIVWIFYVPSQYFITRTYIQKFMR